MTATSTRPRTARPATRRAAPGRGPSRGGPSRRRGLPGTPTREFWWLVGTIGVLNLLGLVMVLSASSVVALDETGSTWSYFARQSTWAVIGTIGLFVFMAIDRRIIRKLSRLAMI
ncbi:MAG: FtsW/RodA/SpoVE family cell cycle protein, partial [Acidimicrobiia bacterium]|nr:FtsW/RodA/SpoVE family cell cycle protein [Acidimicrobiia bacterium]